VNWSPLLIWIGLTNGSGHAYLFWSGIGSDIAELAIIGGLISIYRKHNCGVRRCIRIARHDFTDPGTGIVHHLCRKHHPLHPGKPVTAEHIRQVYHLYLGKQQGKG
jgi:hypothetical protein